MLSIATATAWLSVRCVYSKVTMYWPPEVHAFLTEKRDIHPTFNGNLAVCTSKLWLSYSETEIS